MINSNLKDEEIFFGVNFPDGHCSSLVKRQPTMAELEGLWVSHFGMFSTECNCGKKAYLYSHSIDADDSNMVTKSYVWYMCPNCGKRFHLWANVHLSNIRISLINQVVEQK